MSNEKAKQAPKKPAADNSFGKEILRLTGVLLIISVIVSAALGAVNAITKDKIIAINKEKTAKAMSEIIPDAELTQIEDFTPDSEGVIREVYEAVKDGKYAGLCVKVAPTGFGGEISTIVGISAEGAIIGIKAFPASETAGLGSKAKDPAFADQFAGKSGPLNVVKNQATAENDIVAISGATITSRAVTTGVQAALDFAASYTPEVR